MKNIIPLHTFSGEHTGGIPIRYTPLHVRNDYDFAKPHRHDYFELFLFTKGAGTHHIDFENHAVMDNCIHLVYPGQVHLLQREPNSYGSVVHFTNELFLGMDGVSPLMGYSSFTCNNTPEEQSQLNMLLQQMQEEYERENTDTQILKTYLQLILLKCLQFAENNGGDHRNRQASSFVEFKLLVEKQYKNNTSATGMAGTLGISERKLNEICQASIGQNANAYIKDRIILEAKRLLYNSDLSVKEIAFQLGFEDPSYFNRFFKKSVGKTAGEFKISQIR